ncbi:hypothetical protein KY346_01660 [Candidatus Woesearchaeota archaeon]|nr:hypothetical protein [Candidatus Woesearchaeota archaeon]
MMLKQFSKLSRVQKLKLLAVIVLAEGYMDTKKRYIRLLTVGNKQQHLLFKYLCVALFNKTPKLYVYLRDNKKIIVSTLHSANALEELLTLSPTYKTTPGLQTKSEYLKNPQPTLSFLLDESVIIKQLALRILFDFGGSLCYTFKLKSKKDKKKNKTYQYYQVQFEAEFRIAETNPSVVSDMRRLCLSLGLSARIKQDKRNWSIFQGIEISKIKDVQKIAAMGPITNVKISDKGAVNKGFTKKFLCNKLLRFLKNNKLSYSFKDKKEAMLFRKRLYRLKFNRTD